jgi:hypothetical protein
MSVYVLAEANTYADGCGQDSDEVMPDLHCFKELRHVLWEVDGSPEDLILEDRHVLCALPWPKNANVESEGQRPL